MTGSAAVPALAEPIPLHGAQAAFAASRVPFPAYVGGYGSGKTHALILRLLGLLGGGQTCAYYMPTYGLIHDLGMPRLLGILDDEFGVRARARLVGGRPQVDVPGIGTVLFRSMDAPEAIIGYEVVDSFFDELDTLPAKKAADIWRLGLARNRARRRAPVAGMPPNTMAVATTPEGFRFVYEQWGRDVRAAEDKGYVIHRGRTMDNPALDPAYVQTLRDSYPPNLLRAYLEGEFVNLASGSVYPDFDRHKAHAPARIQPGEPLHVGMDFNVMNMTAVVFTIRDDAPHAVAEYTGVRDTPAMCELLRRDLAGHPLVVYPDASGSSRKSVNAQESDHALLRQAGFTLRVNPSNPAVRDRINAVCAVLPRWKIDTDRCPRLVQALEQQVYDRNGEPDKAAGHDHPADAAGYFIAHRWPIRRRAATVAPLRI